MPKQTADDASFYNRIAHAYDLIADSGESAARRQGQTALDVQPGEQVLEIGFGTGHSLMELASEVGPRGSVTGLDISTKMAEVARKRRDQTPELASHVRLHIGDARQLPFEDQQFDAAFSSFTLELFEEAEIPQVIGEVHRVLRKGGRFSLVTMAQPDDPAHPSRLETAYVWLHEHFPHIVDCRPIIPEPLLEAAGFEISKSNRIAIWSLPVAIVVATKT
ncbi:MAG: class I SAM-dependent methyltransferase [Planctomycetaceae bacterium]